jgi:excisionase family DNA binding protein
MTTGRAVVDQPAVDRLMTIDDVAEYAQIPKFTLYKLHSQRRGPKAAKLGRRLRYRRSGVDAWIATHIVAD